MDSFRHFLTSDATLTWPFASPFDPDFVPELTLYGNGTLAQIALPITDIAAMVPGVLCKLPAEGKGCGLEMGCISLVGLVVLLVALWILPFEWGSGACNKQARATTCSTAQTTAASVFLAGLEVATSARLCC